MELPPEGLVSHCLNPAVEFFSLVKGFFFSPSQTYTYLLLSTLRHTCRLCQLILHDDSRAQAVSINLRTKNVQHWLGQVFSVWLRSFRSPTWAGHQINKHLQSGVTSAGISRLFTVPRGDRSYHTPGGFLWSWYVIALWEQPGIVLQLNSERDMIKWHKTIQAFRSKRGLPQAFGCSCRSGHFIEWYHVGNSPFLFEHWFSQWL